MRKAECPIAILSVLFLGVLIYASIPNVYAQDGIEKGNNKKTISKDDLEMLLRSGKPVENARIIGHDILYIINETDLDINIKNSIIDGGLDFSKAKVQNAGETKLPENLSKEKKETCRKEPTEIKKAYVIKNNIKIIQTEIHPTRDLPQDQFAFVINAEDTVFNNIEFSKVFFAGDVCFLGAIFHGEATFVASNFAGEAQFKSAIFSSDEVKFIRSTFERDAEFIEAKFEARVDFSGVVFRDKALFNNATFYDAAKFDNVEFNNEAIFKNTSFISGNNKAYLSFKNIYVNNLADFTEAKFCSKVDFVKANFKGQTGFGKAIFNEGVSFFQALFGGVVTFSETTFSEGGETLFIQAIFSEEANFALATFRQPVKITAGRFEKLAYFRYANFFDTLDLGLTAFREYVDFRGAQIERLDLDNSASRMVTDVHFDFRDARISKAHFENIFFLKDVEFSGSQFGAPLQSVQEAKNDCPNSGREMIKQDNKRRNSSALIFQFVTFDSNVYFIGTHFSGEIKLNKVNFKKDVYFTYANFKKIDKNDQSVLLLSYVNFSKLYLKWTQITDKIPTLKVRREEEGLETLSEVFKKFENYFRNHNQLEDANEAYYYMKIAELLEEREKKGFQLKRLWLETEWLSWGLCCGYGTKLWQIIVLSCIVYSCFTLIYYTKGNFTKTSRAENPDDASLKLRLFVLPKVYLSEVQQDEVCTKNPNNRDQMVHSLLISFFLLFKLGYKVATISGRLGKIDLRYIVRLEWALGYILLMALVFTLKNTSPLLT